MSTNEFLFSVTDLFRLSPAARFFADSNEGRGEGEGASTSTGGAAATAEDLAGEYDYEDVDFNDDDAGGDDNDNSASADDTGAAAAGKGADGDAGNAEDGGGADDAGGSSSRNADDGGSGEQIPADLLAQAQAAGFSRDEAASFRSAAQLQKTLSLIGSKPSKPDASMADDAAKAKDDEFALPEFDPELYDEKIVGTIKGMHEFYQKRNAALQARLDRLEGSVSEVDAERAEAVKEDFESVLESLGPEFEPAVGKGSRTDLDPKSEQMKTRVEIWDKAKEIAAGKAAVGKPIPSRRKLFRMAADEVLADFKNGLKEKGLVAKVESRNRQSVARPSSRQDKKQTGEEKAIARVTQFYKDHSVDVSDASIAADEDLF